MGNTIKTILLSLLLTGVAQAQHKEVERPEAWKGLVFGGRFMDRFEPLPNLGQRTSKTWGVDAVKPRIIENGIEDPEWSYWGGNILKGDDGRYHLFVCRWPENDPRGHKAWPASEIVHAASDNRFGPYTVKQPVGKGHNPEAYRLADGRYVVYCIRACYIGKTINGPWKREEFVFDPRDRRIVEGLSNLSFVRRKDGSFLMVCRGGGIWFSRDGLGSWEQVTQGSNYPKVPGRYEDPVIWRTPVQYHMIVNDWYGRIAYHLRSKDGAHWKVDSGEAYIPGIAVHADGRKEDWYKYERIKVFQDGRGRAIQANFAVIDFAKNGDLSNDNHSSKNLSIPLTPGRLLTVLNKEIPSEGTKEIRVRIAAEPDFNPHRDLNLESLRFGAPEEVDFGRGCRLLRTEKKGQDLLAVFAGEGHGFSSHNFAGKLLGRTTSGKLLFGYARLPWVAYDEPILSARRPKVLTRGGKRRIAVEIANYGLSAAKPSKVGIAVREEDGKLLLRIEGNCPVLKPWAAATVEVDVPDTLEEGKSYRFRVATGKQTQHSLVYESEMTAKKK